MSDSSQSRCRSILIPLDGSELAERALPLAQLLAQRRGATLHIARVYEPAAGIFAEPGAHYHATLDSFRMKRATEYLESIEARIAAQTGIRSTSALLEGPIVESIDRHAATVGADLLIMTTHGRGPLARWWLGSVADQLVRQSGIPVLFIRPDTAVEVFSDVIFRHVLVPLDGSDLAEQVLEPLFALDEGRQRQYTLLRVVPPLAFSYITPGAAAAGVRDSLEQVQELDRAELHQAHEYLERIAATWRARSFSVETRVLSHDRIATAILEHVSVSSVELVALATHSRGGLKRLVLGSVADKLLRGARSPVLVYRPGATGQ